jgi:serine/threonine transporter
VFVGALKGIAPVLVFVLVASSLANAKGGNADRFKVVIFLYMLSTLIAAFVAVCMNFTFRVKVPLTGVENVAEDLTPPGSVFEVLKNLCLSFVNNPINAIASANYIAILFWAVVIGLALKAASAGTKKVFSDLAESLSVVVRWVINCAPFGIMGLVFNAVSTSGLAIFMHYGQLVALLVSTMCLTSLGINAIIVAITLRRNPYPLMWYCIKRSALTAFFTRSSAANIPVNMKLCEKLGLDKEYYSVAIPLGATINMDGAAITITIMALAAAFSQGVQVNIIIAILLSFVATLGACGASGVAGGSLLLIPMACSLLGVGQDIAMQVVGVGFIIGVVQDSLETAINSSGDVIFCATAEFSEWQKKGKHLPF